MLSLPNNEDWRNQALMRDTNKNSCYASLPSERKKLLSILGFFSFVCYVVHSSPTRCSKLSIPKSKILLHWMQREMPWQFSNTQFRNFDTFWHLKTSGKNSSMTQWIFGTQKYLAKHKSDYFKSYTGTFGASCLLFALCLTFDRWEKEWNWTPVREPFEMGVYVLLRCPNVTS